MTQFLVYATDGLAKSGCIYALVGLALVLTYLTSGMFNLAFGAQAYVSAVVFYETTRTHHWPIVAAFVLSVLIIGPAMGLGFDRLFRRYMQASTTTVKLITAIGISIGVPSIVDFFFGTKSKLNPQGLVSFPGHVYAVGGWRITSYYVFVIAVTLGLVVALALMLRYTRLGLQMRSVVESPRLVELAGISSQRVSLIAWVLSSTVSALVGVMLAPIDNSIDITKINLVLVASMAAAVIAGLSSLWLTLAGGALLGIGDSLLTGYLPLHGIVANAIRPSFPFIVLVAALLLSPAVRRGWGDSDPLAGCDPPRPPLASSVRTGSIDRISRIGFPVFVVVVLYITLFQLSPHYLGLMTDATIYGIVFLSFTVVTGMSGQISLCQMSFAGVGAFTVGQLTTNHGWPFMEAMLVGGLLAAAVGVVVALPSLRLGGLYLALATLGFALIADQFLFPLKQVGNGQTGLIVPRPTMGSINFASDKSFFVLCFIVMVIVSFVVILVRRGTIGTYLAAMRGSEVAAKSIGINLARAKLTVFALSAGIAGIGGALLASRVQHADIQSFPYEYSLVFVVLVLTTGARTVEGALNSSVAFVAIPEILSHLGAKASVLELALFGFGTIQYVKHPEGVLEFQKRKSIERITQFFERRRPRPAAIAGQQPAGGVGP